MGLIRCVETSLTNHPTPRNNPRERLHRSRSLKFRIFLSCVVDYDCDYDYDDDDDDDDDDEDDDDDDGDGVAVFASATVVFIRSVVMDLRIIISRAFN
jgi:hypothetical protein